MTKKIDELENKSERSLQEKIKNLEKFREGMTEINAELRKILDEKNKKDIMDKKLNELDIEKEMTLQEKIKFLQEFSADLKEMTESLRKMSEKKQHNENKHNDV